MSTIGIDFFSGNGTVDLAKAQTEDGITFALRKATEGHTYTDPGFAADFDRAQALGLVPGAYGFARPLTSTPQQEVAHFLSVLGGRRGILALDLEDQLAATRLGLPALATWARTWLDAVHAATGLRPFCYTYHGWWTSTPFAGIRANYPGWIPLDPAQPGEIVQTTHMLGTLGTLDVDTFAGTLDELRQLAGLTPAPAPAPVPAPAPGSPLEAPMFELVHNTATGDIYAWSAGGAWWHVPNTDYAQIALADSKLCGGQRDVGQAEFDMLAAIASSARSAP